MSFLQMSSAPLDDMNKGIIVLWFRDVGVGPDPEKWPDGQWTEATAQTTMVPPWVQALASMPGQQANTFYWDAYGFPIGGPFGSSLYGPAAVMMPVPPPLPISGMRMLMTFGDPDQEFKYCPWRMEAPNCIKAVILAAEFAAGIGIWSPRDWPPPYPPYVKIIQGHPVGADGLLTVQTLKIGSPTPKPGMVPPSFIGIDKDGYVTICLQTNTRGTYKGYAFQQDNVTNIMANLSQLSITGPPYSYGEIGFPFPDGVWYLTPQYWDGYEFWYKDISTEIMTACPEFFVLGGAPTLPADFFGGPQIRDSNWHCLMLSFDISGSVTKIQESSTWDGTGPFVAGAMSVTTTCKAWLALDDQSYDDVQLQRAPQVPNGVGVDLLAGMGHDITGFGPVSPQSRKTMGLTSNQIAPANAWITGTRGNPKDGLLQYVSSAPVVTKATGYEAIGDFDWLFTWTGSLWPLYGHGTAPGPWQGVVTPSKPTSPDPKTFDVPRYECSGFSLPVSGHPIGIPASDNFLKYQAGLEMGELQIWAGKTLDFSKAENRRLFLTKAGKPEKPKAAEDSLGKPDIKLHGSGNWKKGRNTGTTGYTTNPDGTKDIKPAGQFTPVAGIEKFKPNPEVGK